MAVTLIVLPVVVFGTLLLALAVRRRLGAAAVAPWIVAGTACYAGLWVGVQGLLGYPTERALPERFWVDAWQAQEEQRVIYLWATAVTETVPRSYVIEYTRELHNQLHQLGQEQQEGQDVIGRNEGWHGDDDLSFELYFGGEGNVNGKD